MSDSAPHILYGLPPRDLVPIPADAQQCSPLLLGSLRLADIPAASAANAIIYAPPNTLERRYVLARALAALAVDAPLTALAPKDKGGSRIAAELEAFGCSVVDESRSHHRIVTTTRPKTLHGIEDAIAAGGLHQHPTHGLWTQAGVFSWDRIDAGSALLLTHLPSFSGIGADVGCGLGVLSRAVLASNSVSQLTLLDIDRRAIQAAEKNITDSRANFLWADIRASDLALANLDFIVMNPPFHDAGIEDKSLGLTFLTRAAGMLKTGGSLWCVANRHLPYEAAFEQYFSRCTLVTEADGFKIFHAEK
jgi:16S rRNA (guanine1207-N2)-methyltransferase